jgi:hypothetical protein
MAVGEVERKFFVSYDADEIQRNVWFHRRCRAGHLPAAQAQEAAAQFAFDADTIEKADRAFLALYRRSPESQEWTTYYLRLLRQLQGDIHCYDNLIDRVDEGAALPQFAPGSTTLRLIERPSSNPAHAMGAALAGFILLGGFGIYSAATESDISVVPLLLVMVGGMLALPVIGMVSRASVTTSYVCPECRCEYAEPSVSVCRRCHLEFAEPLGWRR